MLDFLWKKRTFIITLLFFLIALLLLIMPPEAKLGQKVRLVYFHASIAENSILFFVLGGLFSLSYLFKRKEQVFYRATSFFLVGFYLWILQTLLGAVNMKVIWGNFFWSEPKAKMGLILLAISLVVYLLLELKIVSNLLSSLLYLFTSFVALFSLILVSNVFHPKNAIFGSDVLAYKIIFVLLVASWLLINLLWSEKIFKEIQFSRK